MAIGKTIILLRKSKNMTQAELAVKINVAFKDVIAWERGESEPDSDTLSKMAKLFGVSESYFADEDGSESAGEEIAISMAINEKIVALRKSNNMTQAELGAKLNVTFQAVSKWEHGMSYPDFETVSKMAKIFGVPISYFEEGGESIVDSTAAAETVAATAAAVALPTAEADGISGNDVIGFCKDCGKLVHTGEEASTTPVVICKSCALRRENARKAQESARKVQEAARIKQKEEAARAAKESEIKKRGAVTDRRNRGLIGSAIITGILLIIYLITHASTSSAGEIAGTIIFSIIFLYTFIAQLFWGGLVVDLFLFGGKIVGMPGVIFTLDLDGLIFLIGVKILFALLKMLIFILTALFMMFVALIVSPFVFIPQMLKLNRGEEL